MNTYYKIALKFCDEGQTVTAEEYVRAATRESALTAAREIAVLYGVGDECGIAVYEADICEMIAKEREDLMAALRREYVLCKFDAAHISLKEYNWLVRSLENDKETDYLVLKRANMKLRIEKFVRKKIKGKQVGVDSLDETVRLLTDAADQEEFDRICRERLDNL